MAPRAVFWALTSQNRFRVGSDALYSSKCLLPHREMSVGVVDQKFSLGPYFQ